MKDTLMGLEWEDDDFSSTNQELCNISLRTSNRGNSSSFLTDPNESISHNDEALGLEFASSIPFLSTPTSTTTSISKLSSELRDISLLDSYPPGFEKVELGFYNNIGQNNLNERTFSSSSNSSNTSLISDNSFNNILRNTQEHNAFRDTSNNNGMFSTSTPYRQSDGFNNSGNNNSVFSRSIGSRLDDPFFPDNNSDNSYRWDFPTPIGLGSSQSSKTLDNDLEQQRFFSSPSRRDTKPHNSLNSRLLDNDFSFGDSINQSVESTTRTSNSLSGSSCIWNSPNSNNGNQHQQQPFQNSALLSQTRLTAKQAINLNLVLKKMLEEKAEMGDLEGAAEIASALQQVQQQLMSELESPSSPTPTTPRFSVSSGESSVDRAAKYHREVAVTADAAFTWSGQLPPRIHRNPTYSCKIFLGGVPFDITESALIQAFKPFGNIKVEWPGKETEPSQPKGYLYVIFEHEKQVKLLLQNCFLDYSKSIAGDWYYKLSSRRFREKDVQVIPWAMSDSNYVKLQAAKIDAKKTIFVGALHGMLNAEGLATIMNDLFSGVVYAGIDTDRYKYPIGSGRVTFNNHKSYMKAVSAAFVEIKTKFKKKIQVDPYVEDATCSVCNLQQGPYFCREWSCFRYFCRTCYQTQHSGEAFRTHRPLMRNASKPQGTLGAVVTATFSPTHGNNHRYNNRGFYRSNM